MPSAIVDFVKEKESGYQRIFSRSPLLSSFAAQWDGLLVAYDHYLPGIYPEVASEQHGIAIFLDIPKPIRVERTIGSVRHQERVIQGDVVVIPAGAWHRVNAEAAGGILILGLDPKEFAQVIDETIERDGIELAPHFATADPLIHQMGIALKHALKASGKASHFYAETIVAALTAHLLQHYCTNAAVMPTYAGGLPQLKLQAVINYIHDHLSDDLRLKELASIAQVSTHHFSQLFKQSTGMPPYRYVIHHRIERSKELLCRADLAIADVAKIVGFVDQSHFHRHFKRLVGVTPKQFIQQAK
ncbi:helix-turn-helix domain-containing protein [filamentous cyanobacterium LEGE 07170]|nr:helix-turn-helix domain-containing protein [filamentous cyanobacterium LEGE 07170]